MNGCLTFADSMPICVTAVAHPLFWKFKDLNNTCLLKLVLYV